MKKEEILKKSRNVYKQARNNDEGMYYAENRGLRKGYVFFALVGIFLSGFDLFYGDGRVINVIVSLLWIFFSSIAYEKYRFTKEKIYIFTFILGSMVSILSLVNYVTATQKAL